MIEFACLGCGKELSVPDASAGKSGRCKFCRIKIIVPSPVPQFLVQPEPDKPKPTDRFQVAFKQAAIGVVFAAKKTILAIWSVTRWAIDRTADLIDPPRRPAAVGSEFQSVNNYSSGELVPCPFCDEPIRKAARKCKHCDEFLDDNDTQTIVNHGGGRPNISHQVVIRDSPRPKWSPGVAAVLSFFIPGLGQLYKGQPFNGLAWFCFTIAGYFFIVPGLILHFCCVLGALMGDPYR